MSSAERSPTEARAHVPGGGATLRAFDYEVNVYIPAPPARVWAAFTLDIDHWWTYRLRDRTRCKIEPFVGGRWTQEWDSGGALFGHFTVYDPPHLLVVTGPLAMSKPATNVLEFIFEPADTGTKITIHHQAFGDLDPDTEEIYANGWKELIGASLFEWVTR